MENIIRIAIIHTIENAIKNNYKTSLKINEVETINDRGLNYKCEYHPHLKELKQNNNETQMFEIRNFNGDRFCTVFIPLEGKFSIKSNNHIIEIKINDLIIYIDTNEN